jgi:hypothetical protein
VPQDPYDSPRPVPECFNETVFGKSKRLQIVGQVTLVNPLVVVGVHDFAMQKLTWTKQ